MAFNENECLPRLLSLRNGDGGWGFREGGASRIEPTAWAILALRAATGKSGAAEQAQASGEKYLVGAQLPDGSWPSAAGQSQGSWVTSLACWALRFRAEHEAAVDRGLRWLLAERPRESSLWWRLKQRLSGSGRGAKQDESVYGWSWTPGTASWVEPTAYACLAIRGKADVVIRARERLRVAEKMLYDRMCTGGGWNAGNPATYGAVGSPEFGPTAWALLTLREEAGRRENREGLEWMEQNWAKVNTPNALALTAITLRAYGIANAPVLQAIRKCSENEDVLTTVPAMAWTILAMSGDLSWLPAVGVEGSR